MGIRIRHFDIEMPVRVGASIPLASAGSGESIANRLFMGWFGPRGLASIVFAIIVLDNNLPGAEFIALVVAGTVFMSLILHGVTANPLAN